MLDRMHMRYRKPSEAIVRDLIFYNLGYVLPDEAKFTQLQEYHPDPVDSTLGRDTKVLVYIPHEAYSRSKGGRWIYYRRLDLGLIQPQGQGQLTSHVFPFSTYDLLDQINILYNIDLSKDDVQDVQYVDATQPYKLIAQSGSLAWKGTLALDVNVTALQDLVEDDTPDGFYESFPIPQVTA